MGRRSPNLRDLVGKIKDKASQSKAALNPLSKPHAACLLRATTHDPSAPPDEKHISSLLSFGHRSRVAAAAVIESLMDRLQTTTDASVAIKCLITVHHIIRHGCFILQDQLSVFPVAGGRNYLKLSNFRDNRSPFSWEVSSWVRWYSRYIENLLSTSRTLGFFICSNSNIQDQEKVEENVSGLLNSDLIKELESLVTLLEDTCKMPHATHGGAAMLLGRIRGFVTADHVSVMNQVSVRLGEFRERIDVLSFGESVELVCALRRLEDCRSRLSAVFVEKVAMDGFWRLMSEVKDKVVILGKDEERMGRKLIKASESARFGPRVSAASVEFSSGRLSGLTLGWSALVEP